MLVALAWNCLSGWITFIPFHLASFCFHANSMVSPWRSISIAGVTGTSGTQPQVHSPSTNDQAELLWGRQVTKNKTVRSSFSCNFSSHVNFWAFELWTLMIYEKINKVFKRQEETGRNRQNTVNSSVASPASFSHLISSQKNQNERSKEEKMFHTLFNPDPGLFNNNMH